MQDWQKDVLIFDDHQRNLNQQLEKLKEHQAVLNVKVNEDDLQRRVEERRQKLEEFKRQQKERLAAGGT